MDQMKKATFVVDKITNSIEDAITGKSYETEILLISKADLKVVLKKNGWLFNWKSECEFKQRNVYKLLINGEEDIQGLVSLEIKDNYVELHLIETAPHNLGKNKKYLGIAANLVAFACKISFDSGYDGFVGFRAKTRLIQHYIISLGATLIFRDRMAILSESARKLVNSYYKNYFDEQ